MVNCVNLDCSLILYFFFQQILLNPENEKKYEQINFIYDVMLLTN